MMIEPLLVKIRDLEKANRRWKALCAILGTMLLAVSVSGGILFGWYGFHQLSGQRQARDEAERARMMEMVAREQVELARQALQQAEEAQRKLKKE